MQQKICVCNKNYIHATKNIYMLQEYICKKNIYVRIFGKLNLVSTFNNSLNFLRKQS